MAYVIATIIGVLIGLLLVAVAWRHDTRRRG